MRAGLSVSFLGFWDCAILFASALSTNGSLLTTTSTVKKLALGDLKYSVNSESGHLFSVHDGKGWLETDWPIRRKDVGWYNA